MVRRLFRAAVVAKDCLAIALPSTKAISEPEAYQAAVVDVGVRFT
jgi:hypothetical protein